jgi:toxin ParE1/3/4
LTYRDKIHDALQFIAQNPQLGYRRNDLPPTHQAHLVGSHIIVYRMHMNGVAIVRILHQRMSLGKHI